MSNKNLGENTTTSDVEAEMFYRFVGQYVILFQWLEGQLDQTILLARGPENWANTQQRLTGLRNIDKINMFSGLVKADDHFGTVTIDSWYEHFDHLIAGLHAERKRRNDILHSQFIFDFLAIGHSPIRSNRRRHGNDVNFTRESLSRERCDDIIIEIGELAADLNLICSQLRQVFKASH